MAIEKLKITAELIRVGGRTIHSEIHLISNFVWKEEELPEEWNKSIIVPIYK